MPPSMLRRYSLDAIILLTLLVAVRLLAQWAYHAPLSATFAADTPPPALPRQGFSDLEHFPDTARPYRWTTGSAQLHLPNPGGTSVVQLTFAGGPGRTVPVELRHEHLTMSFLVTPEPRVYRVMLPPGRGERLALQIDSPVLHEARSKRDLGVVVGDVYIAGGGAVPGLVLLALLAGTIGGYGIARQSRWHAGVVASVVLGLPALVLIWQRFWGWPYAVLIPALGIALAAAAGGWLAGQVAGHPSAPATALPGIHQRRWLGMRATDWAAIGVVLLATIVYFSPYLFTGKTLIAYDLLTQVAPWRDLDSQKPQNWMMGDVITAHAPWRYLYREAYLSGEVPFWNPYTYGGIPFLAYHQTGVLYPPNWIFLLVSVETAFTIFLFAHVLISGLAMYALLRRLTLPPIAALTGALAWMFCGFLTTWLAWLSTSISVLWLPPVVLATDWVLAGPGRKTRAIGALALIMWLTLLGGHPQYTYYNLLTTGAFAVWRTLTLEVSWRQRVVRFTQFLAGCTLGLLIAAVQLLPVLELLSFNTRNPLPISALMAGAIPVRHLMTLLMPEFYGGPNTYVGAGNFVEFSGYIGITSLLLMALALLYPRLQRRSGLWFFGLLALLALHLTYGGILNVPFSYLPAYISFRGLQRIYGIWSFGAAGMAAWGMAAIVLARGWRRQVIGSVAAGLLVAGMLIVWQPDAALNLLMWPGLFIDLEWASRALEPLRWAAWLLVGMGVVLLLLVVLQRWRARLAFLAPVALALLVYVDLLYFSRGYLPVVDAARAFPTTPGLDYLSAHRSEGRVARFLQSRLYSPLPVNTNIVYELEDLHGYGSFTLDRYNRMIGLIEPERYAQVGRVNNLGNFQRVDSLNSPILDLLGVTFLMTEAPTLIDDAASPVEGWVKVYSGPDMTIYRNQQALPLAFVVGAVQEQPDVETQLAVLASSSFDPAQQAVVEQAPDQPFDPNATGAARIVRRTLNTLELDVQVDATPGYAALLLIRQNYYPGWRAQVDGVATPIIQANVNLQGIALAAGSYRVRLVFTPTLFGVLFPVAVVALVFSAVLVLWGFAPAALLARSRQHAFGLRMLGRR